MTFRVGWNPAFLPAEELISQFVVRRAELETLLGVLQEKDAAANQHLLVLGQRGLGKSTLVHRVVAEVRTGKLGKRWYPIVFPEEAYEVANLGEFWLEALARLADQTADPRWLRLRDELHAERDPARVERVARQALETFAEDEGKRLLLVVENLDMLLGEQLSEADAWALRKVLQSRPTFLLLATALRRFEAITHHNLPFYEGFRRVALLPLTAEEVHALWIRISGRDPGLPHARAVRVLTGGNPRMVMLLAERAEGQSLRALLRDLTALVDQATDYFKGAIEALDGQNRRVFLALATLWRPATAGEVGAAARLDGNTASTVLNRLERLGRVEIVGKKGKNRTYQVADRLYGTYWLMRRRGGPDPRITALVDFLVAFHGPEPAGGPAWDHGRTGRPDRALAQLRSLPRRDDAERRLVLALALRLAAVGHADAVVAALADDPVFRPLALALRPGDEEPSAEERDLAAEVVARVAELGAARDLWQPRGPSGGSAGPGA